LCHSASICSFRHSREDPDTAEEEEEIKVEEVEKEKKKNNKLWKGRRNMCNEEDGERIQRRKEE
jgi:hypothetical protein